MSMPPEASAPVLIVSKPIRIGSACARKMVGNASWAAPAAVPAALMNFLRLNVMRRPPSWRYSVSIIEYRDSRSEEHTSELQSQSNLVCRLLLEKKKKTQ